MSDYQWIQVELQGATQIITINRPDVYNALNKDSKIEIIRAIRQANKNNEVRSIILTGNGKAFCTGQDLNDRSISSDEGPVDLGKTLETEWNPLINAIRDSKKIMIGAINGVCAGAGLSVALACDIILAKEGSQFISAFSKLGLAPDAGSSYIFVRQIGYHRTLEFFLLNHPLLAEEMEKSGLINRACSEPLTEALEYAEKINQLAPLSTESIKSNLLKAQDVNFEQSMLNETYTQRFLSNSADYQEGLKAFFEKRPPQFGGH